MILILIGFGSRTSGIVKLTPLFASPASRLSVHCEVSKRWSQGLIHLLHSLFTSREPGGPTLLPKMSGSEMELYNEWLSVELDEGPDVADVVSAS